ncbi:hypothetical protein GGX14DRAFT_555813 [Mycena pura]|uniref:Uncharacterized protein n=1 Tax=Mycena pura TaxID=153505 RepID=A0AAD7E4Q2_9AGAR|nr:hypothetical protein GGX14DRAFT_555813 [Mycena pura]
MPPTAPSHPCCYARNPEPLTHSQLMVVYPASWSICIIGPVWSLIVLYFAPALALWCIGTPVGSQTLPANPALAPRYTDGTPRAHPSSVQSSSVFRALRLLATSSLCLRHRILARFHPASLPGLYALVRSTVSPLVRLLRYWSVNFRASLRFISFRSWSLAAHPRSAQRPSEAFRDFSALFWCYAFSPPLRLGRTICPKLCRIFAMHSWITDVFASAPLPDPLASQGLGPRSGQGFGPELGSPLGVEPLI